MPHLFFGSSSDEKPAPDTTASQDDHDKENMWERTWKQMGTWLKKEDENESPTQAGVAKEDGSAPDRGADTIRGDLSEKLPCQEASCRPSHSVIPSMPRAITFKRQDSERRDRLYPHELGHEERRATSADRRLGTSCDKKISPLCLPELATSIPKPLMLDASNDSEIAHHSHHDFTSTAGTLDREHSDRHEHDLDTASHYDWSHLQAHHHDSLHHSEQLSEALSDLQLRTELDSKWILNLSMHFRDHSSREKFFITYAEFPNHWRRLTISCDYRYALDDSLEAELQSLHYQRDKSARIYEAIRESLGNIQFYDTVTNLKLETSGGRLHVHVTEDVNEIVDFPHVQCLTHLELDEYPEENLEFEGHMSGFVYKVRVHTPHNRSRDGEIMIKKEIPGPEAIDEFLYEINALAALKASGAKNVITIHGIVTDAHRRIKGILLHYCPHGALVDLLYDFRHSPDLLPLQRRLKWTRNILTGLMHIHEAGFVQGDFTLSNIVIDENDEAVIIDINRRGCPIGWEPPEMSGVIRSGGRVGMYIGVKSDLWQCGMCLWGLAMRVDEPERMERPLRWPADGVSGPGAEIPGWYWEVARACLDENPKGRVSAKELLQMIPSLDEKTEEVEVVVGPPTIAVEAAEGDARTVPHSTAGTDTKDTPFVRHPSPLLNGEPRDLEKDVEYLVSDSTDTELSRHGFIAPIPPMPKSIPEEVPISKEKAIPEESDMTHDHHEPNGAKKDEPSSSTQAPAHADIANTAESSAGALEAQNLSSVGDSPSLTTLGIGAMELGNPPLATFSPLLALEPADTIPSVSAESKLGNEVTLEQPSTSFSADAALVVPTAQHDAKVIPPTKDARHYAAVPELEKNENIVPAQQQVVEPNLSTSALPVVPDSPSLQTPLHSNIDSDILIGPPGVEEWGNPPLATFSPPLTTPLPVEEAPELIPLPASPVLAVQEVREDTVDLPTPKARETDRDTTVSAERSHEAPQPCTKPTS